MCVFVKVSVRCTIVRKGLKKKTPASIFAVLRIRIRIRMDPHDFGLLDPHSKCGFQMRMRIRINYLKISVENLFTNTIINIM
jgi:hypothetical protein